MGAAIPRSFLRRPHCTSSGWDITFCGPERGFRAPRRKSCRLAEGCNLRPVIPQFDRNAGRECEGGQSMEPDDLTSPLRQASPLYRLFERAVAGLLLLVLAALGWMTVASYNPDWGRLGSLELEVLLIVGLLLA